VSELRCIHGCAAPLAAIDDDAGVTLYFCAQCRGTFCPGADAARWLGGDVTTLPVVIGRLTATRCPIDGGSLATLALPSGSSAFRCGACLGVFVAPGALPRLRSLLPARASGAPRARPTPRPSAPAPRSFSGAPLSGERLGFDDPWVNLLALPCALLLSWLVSLTTLGRLLLYPVQIQFHELGHAIFAWLSSRAALPLPFGFTFWREDKSLFTGACVLFLLGVLAYRGFHEGRRFAVALAGLLLAVFTTLTLIVHNDTSLMLMIAGGIAGELTLTTLAIVAFFFPMPDRLRWDFFRFLVLVPAVGVWLEGARLWRGVVRGQRELPMGSIRSATDGSGDLDRLIADHHFTPEGLGDGYYALVVVTGLILVLTYGWFAYRSLRVVMVHLAPRRTVDTPPRE
jgi:hypothetical protein